jgi:hypothetical protein
MAGIKIGSLVGGSPFFGLRFKVESLKAGVSGRAALF